MKYFERIFWIIIKLEFSPIERGGAEKSNNRQIGRHVGLTPEFKCCGFQLKIQHDFIAVTEILLNKQAVTRFVSVSVFVKLFFLQTF